MTKAPTYPSRSLTIALIVEWLYVCIYLGGIGMVMRYVPAFAAHGIRVWRLPEDILYSTLCLLALAACGAGTIVAVGRGDGRRAAFLLLVELILMVIFPLTWGWLLYGIVEGGFSVFYALSDRSWEAVSRALPWLLVLAYPAVFLHKAYLVAVYVLRRLLAIAAAA
jgi:hypothetical protein